MLRLAQLANAQRVWLNAQRVWSNAQIDQMRLTLTWLGYCFQISRKIYNLKRKGVCILGNVGLHFWK